MQESHQIFWETILEASWWQIMFACSTEMTFVVGDKILRLLRNLQTS